MRVDPAGLPFIGGAALLAIVAFVAAGWPAATLFLVLAGFFLFFFRDPERTVSARDEEVLAPADGRVMDGMHRVAKALIQNVDALPAKRFAEDPAPDHTGVPLDDLPYEK